LTVLSNNYKIQAQKSADIEKERARLQDILSKLKATLTLSVSQRDDFDRLVKDVVAIFDKKCGGIRPPTAELRSVARISAPPR
jgi:transcriptional regulator